jgi:hypothetical protein
MIDVRAITVRQPWAWAIAHAGKHVENRSRPVSYRGPLLIHTGQQWSTRGDHDPRIEAAWESSESRLAVSLESAVLAVAELVDVHPDATCCRPWGESVYISSDGRRVSCWHYVLDDVRPLPEPLHASGRLGLWRPGPELLAAVTKQIPDLSGSPGG